MKRIEIKQNSSNNFIGIWKLENDDIFKKIIDFFNTNHAEHRPGVLPNGELDKSQKDLIELSITPKLIKENKLEFFKEYINNLVNCYNDYQDQWDYVKSWNRIYIGPFKIEKQLQSGHHKGFNCERQNINSSHSKS